MRRLLVALAIAEAAFVCTASAADAKTIAIGDTKWHRIDAMRVMSMKAVSAAHRGLRLRQIGATDAGKR